MAVDTRDKRFNCLTVARAFTVAAPNPDATISALADRQQIAHTYRGILSAAPTADTYWTITFETSTQKLTGRLAVTCASGGLAVTTATGGLSWEASTDLPSLPSSTGFLITSVSAYLVDSNGDYFIVNV